MPEVPIRSEDDDPNVKGEWMKPEDFELSPEEQARLDEANRQEKRGGARDSQHQAKVEKDRMAIGQKELDPNAPTEMKWKDPRVELLNIEERMKTLKKEYAALKDRRKEIKNQVKNQKQRKLKIHHAA